MDRAAAPLELPSKMTKSHSFPFLFLLASLGTLSAQDPWETPTRTADSLERIDRYESALTYRAKAVKTSKNAPDSIQELMLALWEFTRAEHDFRTAPMAGPDTYARMQNAVQSLARTAPPHRVYRPYWILAQQAFDRIQNLPKAMQYLDSALVHHDRAQVADTLFLIEAMEFSGFINVVAREFGKAVEVSQRGLDLFNRYGARSDSDLELKAKLLYNLALVHNTTFLDIPQKEHLYTLASEKVLDQMENPDVEHLVLVYRRLALFEGEYGNHKDAKGYIEKAQRLHGENRQFIHDKPGVGFKLELALYRAKIAILMYSGDEAGMLDTLARMENLVANNQLDEAEIGSYKDALRFIVDHYLHKKEDPDLALKYIERANQIQLDESKSTHLIGNIDLGVPLQYAAAYQLRGEHEKAFAHLEGIESYESMTQSQKIFFHEIRALIFLDKDNIDRATVEVDRLLATLDPANANFHFSGDAPKDFTPGAVISDTKALVKLAKAWQDSQGNLTDTSEKLYWLALEQFDANIGDRPLTEGLKGTFDKIVSALIEAAISREFSTEESNRLITFLETIRSHDLMNHFIMNRELAGDTQLYQLVEKQQLIRAQITQIKKANQRLKEGDPGKEAFGKELFERELELKSTQKQLAALVGGDALIAKPEINVESLTGKNIILFKAVGDALFKIHFHHGQVSYEKTTGYLALAEKIKAFLSGLTDLQVEVGSLKAQGEDLYKELFQSSLDPSRPTVILPDGLLFYLPFGLLVENGHYLMEDHTISFASSLSFLKEDILRERENKNEGVAFFAPAYSRNLGADQLAVRGEAYALSGAREEVDEIAKLVPGIKYTGDAASKSAFKALADDVAIVHLAMHSVLNDEDPELSSLVFSDAEKDYKLHILELYGLNFDADLAVLSACNTAVGGFGDGGSLVSMHHGFTMAGIPATLASLWNAPDRSTKEIMVSFYRFLKEGKTKAQALRSAKLEYLERTAGTKLSHPFYWAGFILSGNDAPVSFSDGFWSLPVLVGVLLLPIAILAFLVYREKRKRKGQPYPTDSHTKAT